MQYRRNRRFALRYMRSADIWPPLRSETRGVYRRARALAPVDTGEYHDGIEIEYRWGWKDDRAIGVVTATAPHSAAVEWGNRGNGQSAQGVLGRSASGEG